METDKITITCGTYGCGNLLEISFIEQFLFPNMLEEIRDFLKYGINSVYCDKCKKATIVPRISVVQSIRLRKTLIYLPNDIFKDTEKIKTQIASIIPDNTTVDYIDDDEEFKHRIISLIFKTVHPTFSEFTNLIKSGDREKYSHWLVENADKLNKEFFSVCFLIQEKVIPFVVIIVPSQDDLQGLDLLQIARAFYMVFVIIDPEANSDYHKVKIENEIREKVFGEITEAIMFRIILWAGRFEKSRNVSDVAEIISDILPKSLITKKLIEDVSKISVGHDDNEDILPYFTYCLEAVIAALALYSGLDNPNRERWTDNYLSFEYQKIANPEDVFFQNNGVTTEFACQTIKPERVWDHFANWRNRIHGSSAEEKKDANIWAQIIENLNLGNMFYDLSSRSLKMEGEIQSDEIVVAILKLILEFGDSSRPTVRGYLNNVASNNIDNLVVVSRRLRDGLFASKKYDLGIWTVCRTSEILNSRRLVSISLRELEDCFVTLDKLHIWPPKDIYSYRDFLTEQGNCFRYIKDYKAALKNYDIWNTLVESDLQERDFRINERNRAIVLREMLRIDKSLEILNRLLPFADTYEEKTSILTSKAVCYVLLGQKDEAIQFTLDAINIIPDGELADSYRLDPLENLAVLSYDYDPQLAYNAASQAFKIASAQQDIWRQTLAIGILARIAEDSGHSNWKQINNTAIKLINEMINSGYFESGAKDFQVNLLTLLSERLEANEDIKGAEQILLELLNGYSTEMATDYWKVFAKLSDYAFRQGKHNSAKEYLQKARIEIINLATTIKTEIDPLALMQDKVYIQRRLAQTLINEYPQVTTDEDLRSVADFQSSIVLASHIKDNDGVDPKVLIDNAAYSAESLGDTLLDTASTTLAQIVSSLDCIYILFTNKQNGKIVSQLAQININHRDIQQIISETAFCFSMTKPSEMEDPLSKLDKWQVLSDSLNQIFCDFVPKNTHVCMFPGILSGLPLHYPLCEGYSFTYSPSLLTAFLLRARRLKMQLGGEWRPMNLHDFVVWREGESQVAINNFIMSSEYLENNLRTKNVNYLSSKGDLGTQDNLVKALEESDCVKLSCHGRARIDAFKFELLLAADGRLPPQDAVALDADGDKYFLNWDELETLHKASPFIFSTACASGMAVSMAGGERIGIERYLLGSGTLSYLAPHWPVPIHHIQKMMNQIIINYLSNRESKLHQIVYNETVSSIERGVPPWVAKSISILGDWL